MLYRPTSHAAWQAFFPVSAVLDQQIMDTLQRAEPDGLICQEIERRIGRIHQSVSANLRHLVERGFVVATTTYGVTRSNRRAIKWRIAPKPNWNQVPGKPTLRQEAEALWLLAEECRSPDDMDDLERIADAIDEIANRLAKRS